MSLLAQLLEHSTDLPSRVRQAYRSAQCIIDAQDMSKRLDRLAIRLTLLLQDTNPVLVTLLPGAGVLAGQLAGRMVFPAQSVFLQVEGVAATVVDCAGAAADRLDGRVVLLLNEYAEGPGMNIAVDWANRRGAGEVRCAGVVGFSGAGAGAHAGHAAVVLEEETRPLMGTGLSFCGYGHNLPGLYAINDIGDELR